MADRIVFSTAPDWKPLPVIVTEVLPRAGPLAGMTEMQSTPFFTIRVLFFEHAARAAVARITTARREANLKTIG